MVFQGNRAFHANGLCTALTGPTALAVARNRTAVMAELRRLMPRMGEQRKPLPFGLAAIDSHLPDGGLACGALHEIVPAAENCIAAAFGFIAAIPSRRICSPPPCGEGLGVGVGRSCKSVDAFASPHDPHPTLPTRGREQQARLATHSSLIRRHAHLWAAPLPPARPAAWPWPQRARARSGPPDPGRDRAPQGNPVGHGGGGAIGGAGRRRRRHRLARSEIEPTAASRRHRGGSSAFFAAPGADAGIERGGDALAHRHRESHARPFRPRHGTALAFATRALPQRTAG